MICERCGQDFPIHSDHIDGSGPTTVVDHDGSMYWCNDCARLGGTLASVLHICEDEDALGLGGHHAFIEDFTADDVERILRERAK